MYREGYEEHIAGHISAKQPDGTLLVNPYHLRWDELRASHVCRIDLDGNVLEGAWFVSTAIELHLELHRTRDDVGVAVHNHPRWGTVWASLRRVPPVHDQTSSLVDNDIVLYDDYGRPVGDQILERVAARLKTCLREYDVLARLEGDEFGVLLPGADELAARAVAKRFFQTLDVDELNLDEQRRVTVSMGCALWVPPSGESATHILQRAGIALVEARSWGHGQLHVDAPEPAA